MKIRLGKPKLSLNFKSLSAFFINLGSKSLSQIFVLFIILLSINLISQKFFIRFDLTDTKTYTLSNGTKTLISSLPETVTLRVFFSDNIPPDLIQVRKDVKDLYEEYQRYSKGKIKLEIKNPKDGNFSQEATIAGVPEVQYQEYSKDKYAIAQGFLGASISYKDTNESIKLISQSNINNLEYETTSRIYKLTKENKINIGFLTGHGEKSIYGEYAKIAEYLGTQFNVETVGLNEGIPIDPNKIKVLVIAAPTSNFTERDKFEIDQYIMLGGRVVFLADQYQLEYQSSTMTKVENNINDLLKNYGIEVSNSLILDESFLPLQYIFTYPYWILTQKENLDSDNPALSQLDTLVLFWANSLNEAKTNDNQRFTKLIQTTKKAWEQTGESISVDPNQDFYTGNQKQYTLAYLIEGKQTSLFIDKEIPVLETTNGEDSTPVADKRTADYTRANGIEDAKIVVISDSDFITDDFQGGSEQNPSFFLNLVDWLSNSNELIELRSKNIITRSLENISESQKTLTKSVNLLAVPILLASFGIAYNIFRKNKKSYL
jgi:ABC-2 type transport system permease protein